LHLREPYANDTLQRLHINPMADTDLHPAGVSFACEQLRGRERTRRETLQADTRHLIEVDVLD
jgi:hypothetical protein